MLNERLFFEAVCDPLFSPFSLWLFSHLEIKCPGTKAVHGSSVSQPVLSEKGFQQANPSANGSKANFRVRSPETYFLKIGCRRS
jgi:hypothetical protein